MLDFIIVKEENKTFLQMQMMLLDNGMQAKYLVFFLSTLALMTSNGRLCMIWVQFAYLESQTVPR